MRLYKDEIAEAKPMVVAMVDALIAWAPAKGRPGADLRAKVGMIRVNVDHLLGDNALGGPISELLDLAIDSGISLPQIDAIRKAIEQHYRPESIGAVVVKDCLIDLILVAEGKIIANTEFRSRQDVEDVQEQVNEAFNEAAEAVADRMDAMTYRAIVALHAAITFFLIEAARPRPRMMTYRFNQPRPTLVQAYRLWTDASRADELIYENKIIHPAFPPMIGKALSA